MSSDPVQSEILPLLPASDERVALAIFEQYSNRLVQLAKSNLSRKLAGRVDPEDVVQSVFRTFFRREGEGEFQIDCSAQLWQLLVRITILKVRAKARYYSAAMRDAAVEQAIDSEKPDLLGREPGPADAAELVDQIDALLKGLPPLYAQLLGLRLHGRNVSETADELGVSRQTVHRALSVMQERLAAMAAT